MLGSCGFDRVIRLWRLTDEACPSSWRLTDELRGAHSKTVRHLAFSPCGRRLAAAAFDGTVSIWTAAASDDCSGWKCVANLEGHENEVKGVAWSPDGRLLATCGRDKTAWIWEVHDEDDDNGGGGSGGSGGAHRAEQSLDFECLAILAEHAQDVKAVIFSPTDSRTLLSASYDDTIKVWQADPAGDDEWLCSQTLNGHASTVWALAMSSDGQVLASVGDDRALIVYERPVGRKAWEMAAKKDIAHDRPIMALDIGQRHAQLDSISETDRSPDPTEHSNSYMIATGGGDRSVKLWTYSGPHGPSLVAAYDVPGRRQINSVRWNPKLPGLLALAADDGHVEVLQIRD